MKRTVREVVGSLFDRRLNNSFILAGFSFIVSLMHFCPVYKDSEGQKIFMLGSFFAAGYCYFYEAFKAKGAGEFVWKVMAGILFTSLATSVIFFHLWP